jgi:predicted secreted protein
MHARVARYEIPLERIDDAVQGFRDAAVDLREIDGSQGGYFLVDRDEGKAYTITFWASGAALDSSDARAASLRRRAMEASGGTVEFVDKVEVAVEFAP